MRNVIILIKSVFNKNHNHYHYQRFLYKRLHYDWTDISESTGVSKSSGSKGCIIWRSRKNRYGRNRYLNMPEEIKQNLEEYGRNRDAILFFISIKNKEINFSIW